VSIELEDDKLGVGTGVLTIVMVDLMVDVKVEVVEYGSVLVTVLPPVVMVLSAGQTVVYTVVICVTERVVLGVGTTLTPPVRTELLLEGVGSGDEVELT